MAEQEGKTIHSVAKAIRLLDILTESGQPASLTELYQKTGWPKSTIHGLLSTMRESGLIEQTPNGWASACLNTAVPSPTHGISVRLHGRICRVSALNLARVYSCRFLTVQQS